MQDTAPKKRAPPLRFVMSHAEAALALNVSERTLDQLVAAGRLTKRQVTQGRVGYLVREVEELAESLPALTPGLPAPQVEPQGA